MASRSDFPSLLSTRQRQRIGSGRGYHVCRCCGLTVEPRNSRRHFTKCQRLRREDPALWHLWRMDMNWTSDRDIRKRMPRQLLQELVGRGEMTHGPTLRDGWIRRAP